MTTVEERFYITGGTLPLDADSYVVRRADTELLNGLRSGEFCYVLNTRQMGKSSLMIRTARRLKDDGYLVAILDLTAIGLNLSVEQWYLGMLVRMASQIGFEDELLEFWRRNKEMGPMQRFVEAIRRIVLAEPSPPNPLSQERERGSLGPSLVVFVDEIDSVLSLGFSADEFFAGIRQCYNRRAEDPVFDRLTFCLVGVATPADLIRAPRMSPFNIGRRIELPDFSLEESALLTAGIEEQTGRGGQGKRTAKRLLDRVIYWTNGHPYMTQRLCKAVADRLAQEDAERGRLKSETPTQVVDAVCSRLFLTKAALETDDNLTFVRNRLLNSDPGEAELASLLDLYQRVRSGRRIHDDETNPLCAVLRLSGVVSGQRGLLRLRNRIYDSVFDRRWIAEHMPGAELRRQRRAYRRGILRAATIGTLAVLIASSLAGLALSREVEARRARDLAQSAGRRAAEQEKIANARLSRFYVASGIKLIDDGDYAAALTPLAEAMALDRDDPERMRQHRMRLEFVLSLAPRLERVFFSDGPVRWAEFSPDKRMVLACDETGRARVWQVDTGAELPMDMRHEGPVDFAAFSPDGIKVVTCGDDAYARIWDVRTRQLVFTLRQPIHPGGLPKVVHASWSPDSRILVTVNYGGAAIWNVGDATAKRSAFIDEPGAVFSKTAVSPDGKFAALIAGNYLGWVVDLHTGKELHPIGTRTLGGFYTGNEVKFSHDGRLLAAAGGFGGSSLNQKRGAGVFDAKTGAQAIPFLSHGHELGADVAFSSDGARIATAGDDQTARLWDGHTGRPLCPPLRLGARVSHVRFSSDGRRLLAASVDGRVNVWDAATAMPVCAPIRHAGAIVAVQFGRDSSQILTASKDGTTRIWALPPAEPPSVSFSQTNPEKHDPLLSNTRMAIGRIMPGPNKTFRSGVSICDMRTGKELFPRDARADDWNEYGLSGDRRRTVLFAWREHKAQVWDVESGRPVSPAMNGDGGVLNNDGKFVFLRDANGSARLVEVESGKIRFRCKVRDFCPFSPDGRAIAIPDDAGTVVRLISVDSGAMLGRPMSYSSRVWKLDFSRDGRYLFTINVGGFVQAWNVPDGTPASPPRQQRASINAYPAAIYFSPDGRYAISAGSSSDALSLLWRLDGSKTLQPKPFGAAYSRDVKFSPDGSSFVAVNQGSAIWDTARLSVRVTSLDHSAKVNAVAFSPDGRRIASASDDGTARIWNALSGRPLTPPMVYGKAVVAIEFSPDGRNVVTGGADGAVRVWDAVTGEAITPFLRIRGPVVSVEFTADGSRILAAGGDETKIWDVRMDQRPLASISAVAQLLSGVRMDPIVGSVAVDRNRLRECWREYKGR